MSVKDFETGVDGLRNRTSLDFCESVCQSAEHFAYGDRHSVLGGGTIVNKKKNENNT